MEAASAHHTARVFATGSKGVPYSLVHGDHIAQQFEEHPLDQLVVTLMLTDDMFLRSCTWAPWQLGIPVSVD
jgi:hypothetical protein